MPTINQLLRKKRIKPLARNKVPALEKQPLKKRCVCTKFIQQLQKNQIQH